ncbi:MAG: polyprenyl synthetase family protein [Blastocatellia bacterium]
MRFSTAQIFHLIRRDLLLVEEELERQSRTNLQILSHLNRYLLSSGGKRLRPALLLLAAKVFGEALDHSDHQYGRGDGNAAHGDARDDDIIDGAEIRRGKKTVAQQWGNDIAVLLGDWLYMTAFETSLQQRNLEVLDVLTEATRKMTEGELLQLPLVGDLRITEEQHFDIVQRKTGFLFSASCRLGGVQRGASAIEKAALEDYGMNLGIAFQLTDDLLDFTSDAQKLGKPVLSDLREGKVTLPLIRLLDRHPKYEALVSKAMNASETTEENEAAANKVLAILREYGQLEIARDEALSYAARAQEALESLPDNQYRQALHDIAQFVVERDK